MLACNQILKAAQDIADKGLALKANTFNFDEAMMISISNSSWTDEDKVENNKVCPRRSQFGRVSVTGSPDLWDKDKGRYHLLGWKVD
eukprot:7827340-Karenia_brevis.AAC.1